MKVESYGKTNAPLLVCVHGLMGHVHDFSPFIKEWEKHFHILVPDYAPGHMEKSYTETVNGQDCLMYDLGAEKIAAYLKTHFPNQKAYFAGISVGGKISIEIAGRYPELFAGAVVTDVGLGQLSKSNLCQFIEQTIPYINMQQEWKALRLELREKIPDRMLRILVQGHIEYKDKSVAQASWRDEGRKFYMLLRTSNMEDLWELEDKIQGPIVILKAPDLSAIADDDFKKMGRIPQIKFIEVPKAGH